MLSEAFVASSSGPPKTAAANSALLKNAGIFVHAFQPQSALRATFKKSQTAPNGLAVSASHIFAAQEGKAVVNVYNREKGNQEALVSFPERICSIVLASEGTVLALGTEAGSIILWEVCTGRQVISPPSHLQPVTALAVDLRSNFLLSGSTDSFVHVWSLLDLLSFQSSARSLDEDASAPQRTFSGHHGPITALVAGHSGSFLNFAVSASKDTAHVWNYHNGDLLRTFLLPSTPLCLTLDPADRAFYAGYEDGSVQLVEFYTLLPGGQPGSIYDTSLASTAIQPPSTGRWSPPAQDTGSATCVSLCYDATIVITGHLGGKVLAWDVASGRFMSTVADLGGAPLTNLQFLPPTGFQTQRNPRLKITSIVKPRHLDPASANGRMPDNYSFVAQFPSNIRPLSPSGRERLTPFEMALTSPSFPDDLIAESLAELTSWNDKASSSRHSDPSANADFMHLDSSTAPAHATRELEHLRAQVLHLRSLQETSFTQIGDLDRERRALQHQLDMAATRRAKKLRRRREKVEMLWEPTGTDSRKTGGTSTTVDANASGDESSGSSNGSLESTSSNDG